MFYILSEKLIKQTADRMAADGYKDAGYQYVSIDDCWASKERDSKGRLQPDPKRFPSGMKALADYVRYIMSKFYSLLDTNLGPVPLIMFPFALYIQLVEFVWICSFRYLQEMTSFETS